ncbi:MAG: Gfo/Idh/MocA family protein [Bacteroidota bacterium]|jgi:predicted dehydrogenase
MKKIIFVFALLFSTTTYAQPVRLAVAGISHGHNGWILGRKNDAAVQLVGIYEPNKELVKKMMDKYHLDPALFYDDINEMLEEVKPEGVLGFGTTLQHLSVVEACAPKGIHVMVEKPLATTVADAEKMVGLARKHKILLLTNFETSWYPTTDKSFALTRDTSFMGAIRKVVVHDGHEGPKEIGVSKEFFEWLTDPVQNGGGALMDFGCYGANLMTLLMNGSMPLSVTAVTSQFKPHIYPKVDDEATIILQYPGAQCIIQASWNWPFARKDMAIYGSNGYIITKDNYNMKAKGKVGSEVDYKLTAQETNTYTSPFLYFADAIRNKISIPAFGAYSIENNLIVVRILEAARNSAKTGKTIYLK